MQRSKRVSPDTTQRFMTASYAVIRTSYPMRSMMDKSLLWPLATETNRTPPTPHSLYPFVTLLQKLVSVGDPYPTFSRLHEGETEMKILQVLENAEVGIVDLEVNLGDETHSSPTLCVRYEGNIIPLSTPDARPILMKSENAIKTSWMSVQKGRLKWPTQIPRKPHIFDPRFLFSRWSFGGHLKTT